MLAAVIVGKMVAMAAAHAVGAMLAAVPGATIKARIGLTFIAVLSIGLGPLTAAPVAIAVVTSHLLTAAVVALLRSHRAELPAAHA